MWLLDNRFKFGALFIKMITTYLPGSNKLLNEKLSIINIDGK